MITFGGNLAAKSDSCKARTTRTSNRTLAVNDMRISNAYMEGQFISEYSNMFKYISWQRAVPIIE
ncbi:MAG: hypothetical protein PHQ67_11865 [Fermentimonas sp.]|nr:hypothetical protein [Fermentimonas sp.]